MTSLAGLTPVAIGAIALLLRPRGLRPPSSPRWTLAPWLVALWVLGAVAADQPLLALAAIPLWLGAVGRTIGGPAFALKHWPLWLTGLAPLLLVPPVEPALNHVLRTSTAWLAALLLRALGMDAHADGTTIVGLGVPVYVTAQCAGVAVLLGPSVVATLVASIALERARERWVLAAVALLASAVSNLLRVVLIAGVAGLLGQHAATEAHDPMGLVMALCSYTVVGLMLRAMMTHEAPRPPRRWRTVMPLVAGGMAALWFAVMEARGGLRGGALLRADGTTLTQPHWDGPTRLLSPDSGPCDCACAEQRVAEQQRVLATRAPNAERVQLDGRPALLVGFQRDLPVVYVPGTGTLTVLPSWLETHRTAVRPCP